MASVLSRKSCTAPAASRRPWQRPRICLCQPAKAASCVLATAADPLAGCDTRLTTQDTRTTGEDGQATIEAAASISALALAGLLALQLLVAGYALTLADGAAEAGALALAGGRPAKNAVRESLPGWAAKDVEVTVRGGEVTIRLHPPSPLPPLADLLAVSSSAFARPAPK